MLKNYLKIAFRNIRRNKLRTGIHILGLSIGIAICFLIFNVVMHAYSFDNFHPEGDKIFRVTTLNTYGENRWPNQGAPYPLAGVIQQELPGIEEKSHFYMLYETMVSIPESKRNLGRTDGVTLADIGFFRIFPRKWLAGDTTKALQEPNTVVLTQTSATKYFPDHRPDEILGKEILYFGLDSFPAVVTGIVEDYRDNTDLLFNDFISLRTLETISDKRRFNQENWERVNSSSQLFIKINDHMGKDQIEAAFPGLIEKYLEPSPDQRTDFFLDPLDEVHFNGAISRGGDSKILLKGLGLLGSIILILACLNFINLETAHAIHRAREVGIRKTLGSSRGQLIFQFLSETYIIVVFATIISLTFVESLKLISGSYLPDGFDIDYLSVTNLSFLLSFGVGLTILSGMYPALLLGGYDPQKALKGEKKQVGKLSFGVFLRKNLTVIQFTCSITFIIMVLVVNSQLRYLSQKELGFDREAVLLYTRTPFMDKSGKKEQLKERLAQLSYVKTVGISSDLIASMSMSTDDLKVSVDTTVRTLNVQNKLIDTSFVGLNGLKILAGINITAQSDQALVNEAFVKALGLTEPEEALGISFEYADELRKVTGVVNNFHSRTLREDIKPLILVQLPDRSSLVSVKLEKGADISRAKVEMESLFKDIYPHETGAFSFLDEELDKFYQDDQRLLNILGFSCGLAILISCLGLFGLSSFTIAQRSKEISIRRVLGATMSQVLVLISKDYLLLIGISFGLASGLAWLFAAEFLKSFAYKITMPYGLFLLSGMLVLMTCLVIVGLHSFNAARTNPAQVLKDE